MPVKKTNEYICVENLRCAIIKFVSSVKFYWVKELRICEPWRITVMRKNEFFIIEYLKIEFLIKLIIIFDSKEAPLKTAAYPLNAQSHTYHLCAHQPDF